MMMAFAMQLYHVSDLPRIERFEPRPPPSPDSGVTDPVVWAIDGKHWVNYLLPRNCPRVTFGIGPNTTQGDIVRLLGKHPPRRVVAIESGWFERALEQVLHAYVMPSELFTPVDLGAGYFISKQPVIPESCLVIPSALRELISEGVEVRVMPSLWALRDEVISSTLEFSLIRMRHAQEREGFVP